MRFIWQHRRFSPHFIQLTSGSMILLLLFATFLLNTTTSVTFNLVLSFGQMGNGNAPTTNAEQTMVNTLSDTSNMLGTYVAQWNSFDNSLNVPPAIGSTTAIQDARQ